MSLHVCVSPMPVCAWRGGGPHVLGCLDPGAVLQAHRCVCGKGVSPCPRVGGEDAPRCVSISRCPTTCLYFGTLTSQLWTNAPPLQSADPGRALALSSRFAVLGHGASSQRYRSKESPGAPRKAEGQGSEAFETSSYLCTLKGLRVWCQCWPEI